MRTGIKLTAVSHTRRCESYHISGGWGPTWLEHEEASWSRYRPMNALFGHLNNHHLNNTRHLSVSASAFLWTALQGLTRVGRLLQSKPWSSGNSLRESIVATSLPPTRDIGSVPLVTSWCTEMYFMQNFLSRKHSAESCTCLISVVQALKTNWFCQRKTRKSMLCVQRRASERGRKALIKTWQLWQVAQGVASNLCPL